ncbi:MAG TPA: hypothetical protein VNU97_12710 [Rhizomicrobium sp.]|jgi:hypothetical protein|nr:hypothetical protein [Rhizomicrobium sp.]
MSVLETPRIYFKGEMAWDPITTNNYTQFYDESTDTPVFPGVLDKVRRYREEAIAAVPQNADQSVASGSWNPDGTHKSVFYASAISGVDLGAGVTTKDPFVASAANFMGMLVDCEPYGSYSSQLFFDTMHFGVDGGYRILGKRTVRATARYININRNPSNNMIAGFASVVWQTSFAKADGLRVDAFDSPALQALAAALQEDDVLGLTVRFNTYRTIYYDTPALANLSPLEQQVSAALVAKLTGGGFQPNPARSAMVGVIGLWRKGEPAHEPGDRALLTLTNAPPSVAGPGSAYARVDSKSLTLDLSNCIPESDRVLTKTNLGKLQVFAVDAQGNPVASLGTFGYPQYDRDAYDAAAGLVALPLDAAAVKLAQDNDLQLRDSNGTVLLAEQALRTIPLTPNLYLDEGTSPAARFQLYNRGVLSTAQMPVTVYTMSADGGTITATNTVSTDAQGVLSLPVSGTPGGVFAYMPSPDPNSLAAQASPPANGINPQVYNYTYVRTWPADAAIAELPPTWENVYARVLVNWNALAPCMDNWLRLDDPVQVKAYGAVLKRLTDPAHFEDFRFMPVTRDMTGGERKLLYKFLDAPPEPAPRPLATEAASAPPSRARTSRAMRSG